VQSTVPWHPQSGDTGLWLEGIATGLQPGDAILIVGADRMGNPGSERWDVRVLSEVEPDNPNARTRIAWRDPLGSAFPAMAPASIAVEVHALRQRTALFGHNAPDPNLLGNRDSNVDELIDKDDDSDWQWKGFVIDAAAVDLDTDNPKITAGSWFALVSNQPGIGSADLPGYTELYRASKVIHRTRSAFGISGKVTRITPDTDENLTAGRFPLRRTLVLAQSERLATVDTPLSHPVYGDALTLGRPVAGLVPGQAIALRGRRQRIAIRPNAAGLTLELEDGGSVALEGGDELFLLGPPARLIAGSAVALGSEEFAALIGHAVPLRLQLLDRDGRRGALAAFADDIVLRPGEESDPTVSEVALSGSTADDVVHGRDHTFLKLQQALGHVYERASLRVNANVAPATHGETVEALLGSGDASTANQRFVLNQAPLTYVSANTPSGGTPTLEVRINDVLWAEVPTLYRAGAEARLYQTLQDDDGFTTIQFGDGIEGARLPSGESNVRARYRKGLGAAGNVAADKLTTLLSRPLGVGEVTNPEPASGGEDGETLGRARVNAPLTVLTLDRAVSITDYANFARAFAGIDKAHALWIPAGPAYGVFLTIAGVAGAAVAETGETFTNLSDALRSYGDPLVPLRITNYSDARFRCRLAVKVLDAHPSDKVLAAVDDALRTRFGFTARDFGQTVSVDEVSAVAQAVEGVAAVHVTRLHRAGEPAVVVPRLFAALPVASLTALPQAAELLTLADDPIELEELP
jgi:hypothetical protein